MKARRDMMAEDNQSGRVILAIAESKSSFDGSEKLKRLESVVGYDEFFWIEIIEKFLRTL